MPSSGNAKMFCGDAEGYVDRLVECCEQRPAPLPVSGYGRELVPFFTTEDAEYLSGVQPLEAATSNQSKAMKRQKGFHSGASRHTSSARTGSPPLKQVKETPTSPSKMTSKGSNRGRQGRAADRQSSPASRSPAAIFASPASAQLCGPGFQMSPKPEVLPMPTVSLIQRAVARAELLLESRAFMDACIRPNTSLTQGVQVAAY